MSKNKNPTNNDARASYRLFIRYSNITFFLVVSILLAIGVALLFFMVTKADNIADTSSQLINQSFEEETIERVRSLSDNISNIQDTHPQDRTNPFY